MKGLKEDMKDLKEIKDLKEDMKNLKEIKFDLKMLI